MDVIGLFESSFLQSISVTADAMIGTIAAKAAEIMNFFIRGSQW